MKNKLMFGLWRYIINIPPFLREKQIAKRKCEFFWSEAHAREYRKKTHRIRGAYLNATQMKDGTRIIQSAIFGFKR